MRFLRRTAVWFVVFSVVWWAVAPAEAALKRAIENALESWFDSAGRAAILLKERLVPSIPVGTCVLVMDRSTDSLMAKCNTASGENQGAIMSGNPFSCVDESGTGDLVCKTVSTYDQNLLSPPAANRLSLYDNDVDLTPNPICANLGVGSTFRIFDQVEGAPDAYIGCTGTTPVWQSFVTMPFGAKGGGQVGGSANECQCVVGSLNGWIADLNNIEVEVTTADGTTTGTSSIGIYSIDGQTQYFASGAITTAFQSTGDKTIANTITTPSSIPPGDSALICLAVSTNATDLRLRSVRDSGAGAMKVAAFTTTGSGCNAGAVAATLTPTLTYAATDVWYLSLSGL